MLCSRYNAREAYSFILLRIETSTSRNRFIYSVSRDLKEGAGGGDDDDDDDDGEDDGNGDDVIEGGCVMCAVDVTPFTPSPKHGEPPWWDRPFARERSNLARNFRLYRWYGGSL